MKKFYLFFLMSLLLSYSAFADTSTGTFVEDGVYYFYDDLHVISKGKAYVVASPNSWQKYSGVIHIPNSVTYNGKRYTVSFIDQKAFSGCSGLTEVTIPNSVESIYNYAFQGCTSLKRISIPNSVTQIYDYVFQGCNGLEEVDIPNSITSIGDHAFDGCSGLKEINIPNSVRSIGYYAFNGCTGLTSITFPGSVTSMDEKAFSGCNNIKELIVLEGIYSLSIPSSYSSSSAFADCPIEKLYLGRAISAGTTPLFKENATLKTVVIGDSITSIAANSFAYCYDLTDVVIGANVKYIGESAFYYCPSIVSVTSFNPIPPEITESTFDKATEILATLHVPTGRKTLYELYPYWENFFNVQDDISTNIDNVTIEREINKGVIYTINGAKCNTTDISDLPKGVYIVNGKKIFVK